MCRSPWASRSAISAKEARRPNRMASIRPRALAMAASRTSRLSGLIAGFAQGACTMPFTAVKLGAVHASVIVGVGKRRGALEVGVLCQSLARGNQADFQCLRLDDHARDMTFRSARGPQGRLGAPLHPLLQDAGEWLICFQVGDERSSILLRGQLVTFPRFGGHWIKRLGALPVRG
jgi:hypothetical protein